MGRPDVNSVMGEALSLLQRITDHLREKDANEVANEIAKNAISILETFNDAVADWESEECLMKAMSSMPASLTDSIDANNGEAISEQIQKTQPGSWAVVAASATPTNERIPTLMTGNATRCQVPREPSTPATPTDARVIWIRPWHPGRNHLSSVTEKIVQGPLFSVAYSQAANAVCVIFQHAQHARDFLDANGRCMHGECQSLFGPQCEVIEGQAYPMTRDLQRMESMNERRRLTFARCRLFASGMTEARFKQDIFGMVGEDNVDLVWLFNSGNATVVFSATVIARTVREQFLKRAAYPGPYQDVMVTFSHDPCERPLNRITQMQVGRNIAAPIPNNGAGTNGFGQRVIYNQQQFNRPQSSPRGAQPAGLDAGGWQVVAKRK